MNVKDPTIQDLEKKRFSFSHLNNGMEISLHEMEIAQTKVLYKEGECSDMPSIGYKKQLNFLSLEAWIWFNFVA